MDSNIESRFELIEMVIKKDLSGSYTIGWVEPDSSAGIEGAKKSTPMIKIDFVRNSIDSQNAIHSTKNRAEILKDELIRFLNSDQFPREKFLNATGHTDDLSDAAMALKNDPMFESLVGRIDSDVNHSFFSYDNNRQFVIHNGKLPFLYIDSISATGLDAIHQRSQKADNSPLQKSNVSDGETSVPTNVKHLADYRTSPTKTPGSFTESFEPNRSADCRNGPVRVPNGFSGSWQVNDVSDNSSTLYLFDQYDLETFGLNDRHKAFIKSMNVWRADDIPVQIYRADYKDYSFLMQRVDAGYGRLFYQIKLYMLLPYTHYNAFYWNEAKPLRSVFYCECENIIKVLTFMFDENISS